jgi:hypothetical protein
MAAEIKFLIDGQDRGQPTNAKDFGLTISEEQDIRTRIVSFNNDLIFSGELYNYLFGLLVDNGICNLVNVEVQYNCNNLWKKLVDGYFIVSEIIYDYDKCTCKTKMYDTSFSTRINNNKDIPFSLKSLVTKNLYPKAAAPINLLRFFNSSTCAYPANTPVNLAGGVSVYNAFKSLIESMSDNLIDFESDFFKVRYQGLGGGTNYWVTKGRAIRLRENNSDIIISFAQLFQALNSKLNLGIGFEKQYNGRPLMRIEPIAYFYQQSPSVNLYDQPNITLAVDKTQLYGTIRLGCNESLQIEQCNGGNCTFIQTPIYGFQAQTFGFIGNCNTSTSLDIQSKEVIIDTNIIDNTYRLNDSTYDENPFIIHIQNLYYPPFGGFPAEYQFNAIKSDPYNNQRCYYNISLNNLAQSFNWRNELHNSIAEYQAPYSPASTNFDVRVQSNLTYQIQYDFTTFFETNNYYLKYLNEIVDTGNNFEIDKYVIPRAGQYTFYVSLKVSAPVPYDAQAIIQRFNSDDVLVSSVASVVTNQSGGNTASLNKSYTGIFNQGDIVRTDVRAKHRVIGGNDFYTFTILTPSLFEGNGTPFENEFQAVDPNASKKILYNFNRPLTMVEIENIMDNTSRPIAFGRYDDPIRVINGYIKKLDIKSVIEQEAAIQLKSNLILR